MAKPDPRTETRRELFRAYCKRRGWYDEARDRWAVTEIAQATLKPTNKVSDLLNGKGTFGAKIARELEAALGLGDFELEMTASQPEPGEQLERPSAHNQAMQQSSASGEDIDTKAIIEETFGVLAHLLEQLDEQGRVFAFGALTNLVNDPATHAKAAGMFDAAVRNHTATPPPPSPRPTTKRPAKKGSAAAARKPSALKLSVQPGGGQRTLYESPLPNLYKAHDRKTAPARELEWYEHLKTVPKGAAGEHQHNGARAGRLRKGRAS